MYISREIRWFFEEENATISEWFKERGLFFHTTRPRTDYYYALINSVDVGFKLREGRIEYKHRISETEDQSLHKNAKGNFENWVKWSYNLNAGDSTQKDILKDLYTDAWIKVYKERVGVKVYNNEEGNSLCVNLSEHLDDGCQVEYTRILVNGRQWYTFGLEYFGNKVVEPDSSVLDALLEGTKLSRQDAMSYPKFFIVKAIIDQKHLNEEVIPDFILDH